MLLNVELEPLLNQRRKHLENAYEIALTGSVGPNQHVEVAQLEFFEGAD